MASPNPSRSERVTLPIPRPTSAPIPLDSNMLFAFPVPSSYTFAFTNSPSTNFHEHHSSDENQDEPFHPTEFMKTMINDFVLNEESPKNSQIFHEQSHTVAEFTPIGIPFFNLYSNSSPQFTAQDIYSHAYEMAKDQIGCRMLQKKLEEMNPYSVQTIFDQIQPHLPELMIDPFGNYLIQKLLEVCEESVFSSAISAVSNELANISLNPHGTRAVQKLIDLLGSFQKFVGQVVNSLKPEILTLIKDINGNHVVQRCVNSLKSPKNQFIYDVVGQNILQIATDRHGCCVLQRCIQAATDVQKDELVEKIIVKAVELVQDAFGNYVVQYVIDLNSEKVNEKLAFIFMSSIQKLATQKFSSNVIEKCLQQNTEEIQQKMIEEIGKEENVGKMIGDQYANYGRFYLVVQRALMLARPKALEKMLGFIKPKMEELKASHFGKKIYLKLVKNYPDLSE